MSKVFISYSHKDEKWMDEFLKHLHPYMLKDEFEIWSDSDIYPGEDWEQAIERSLHSSDVFVLLISADYLNSDFIKNSEIPSILDISKKKNTIIIPVILSATIIPEHLSKYQFANSNKTALNTLNDDELRDLLLKISQKIYSSLQLDKLKKENENTDIHDIAFDKAISIASKSCR